MEMGCSSVTVFGIFCAAVSPPGKRILSQFVVTLSSTYERVMEIDCEFFIEDRDPGVCCIKISQFSNLREAIREFISNHKIQNIYWKLDKLWEWYIEIREILDLMRISMNETRILTEDDVEKMKINLKAQCGSTSANQIVSANVGFKGAKPLLINPCGLAEGLR